MNIRANIKTNGFGKLFSRQESAPIVIFIAMIIIVASIQSNFFTPSSLKNSLNSFAPLILMAMGQAIVLVSGGLDLSSGTSMALMLCVLTRIMKKDDPVTGVWALLVALGVMLGIGLLNGAAVGYLKLPPIIATFATSYIWFGIALFVTPTPGGESVNWMRAFFDFNAVNNMPDWLKAFGAVVPTSVLLILAGCVVWYIVSRTKTGRYMYAVGSNRVTAYQSGIKTAKIQTTAYILNSFFLLLCALFFTAQNQAGSARIGDPLTLQCIAAAVVGGIALNGGRGNVFLAIIGAVIMSLVGKIIFFANMPDAYQTLVSGVIIIIAIASSAVYSTLNERAALRGGK
jgi:ribose transport system permease protein